MFTQYYRSTNIRSSNLTATYNNHVLKPQPILNAVVRQGIIRYRKRLSLFTETIIGTPVTRRRQFTQNSTMTTSIQTVELRFQNRGSPTINILFAIYLCLTSSLIKKGQELKKYLRHLFMLNQFFDKKGRELKKNTYVTKISRIS